MIGWIKCSDVMPPVGTDIMVCSHQGDVTCARLIKGSNYGYWDGVGFDGEEWSWNWYDLSDREPGQCYGVTHWMPLPDPPTEIKDPVRGETGPMCRTSDS